MAESYSRTLVSTSNYAIDSTIWRGARLASETPCDARQGSRAYVQSRSCYHPERPPKISLPEVLRVDTVTIGSTSTGPRSLRSAESLCVKSCLICMNSCWAATRGVRGLTRLTSSTRSVVRNISPWCKSHPKEFLRPRERRRDVAGSGMPGPRLRGQFAYFFTRLWQRNYAVLVLPHWSRLILVPTCVEFGSRSSWSPRAVTGAEQWTVYFTQKNPHLAQESDSRWWLLVWCSSASPCWRALWWPCL